LRLNTFYFLLLFLICAPLAIANTSALDSGGQDENQVYHVVDQLDLIIKLDFRYGSKPKIFVKYVYPKLENDEDEDEFAVEDFNQKVADLIELNISDFKERIEALQRTQEKPPLDKKNDLYIDYDSSIFQAKEDLLISLRFSFQSFIVGMAHPSHYHRVLNFNLNTGEEIILSDLFKPEVDYLTVLATFSRELLEKHLKDKQLLQEGSSPTAEHYQNWNLKANGLLITFDEAQVASYVQGAQSVLIPYAALKEFLSPDAPLLYCAKNKYHCLKHRLLTGGFIDES
jgi:hypothetical protein